jgi:flagella basal body P-ring formation protein FlgA
MRAGTHAVLIMNDRRMRIQIPVISLETGKAGETIHVASPDRKQVYEGEVVDGTLLWRKF